MATATYVVADVRDALAAIPDGDAILIDLDPANIELAQQRLGMFLDPGDLDTLKTLR